MRIDDEERVLRVYHVGNRRVWGLTALIVQNLLQRLGLEPVEGPPRAGLPQWWLRNRSSSSWGPALRLD